MVDERIQAAFDEIADGIYRISVHVPEIGPPAGFTFNQFLVDADEPLLFHTGPKAMFPLVVEAVAQVRRPDELRWISFGHYESDECGSMNLWLDMAPHSQVAANEWACMLSIADQAARPPRTMIDGEILDLGGKRLRLLSTPHVPHNWESQMLFEETTGTLLCGDLFSHFGGGRALVEDDIVGPAIEFEDAVHQSSLSATSGATIRRLADLEPTTLAIMHGRSFRGDGSAALRQIADEYDRRVREALDEGLVAMAGAGCPDPT
ncbi:MAG: MBL fold metallo-hydrolase [Acidimicrobiales bacterium]